MASVNSDEPRGVADASDDVADQSTPIEAHTNRTPNSTELLNTEAQGASEALAGEHDTVMGAQGPSIKIILPDNRLTTQIRSD